MVTLVAGSHLSACRFYVSSQKIVNASFIKSSPIKWPLLLALSAGISSSYKQSFISLKPDIWLAKWPPGKPQSGPLEWWSIPLPVPVVPGHKERGRILYSFCVGSQRWIGDDFVPDEIPDDEIVWSLAPALSGKKKKNNDGIAGDEGVQRESNKGEGRMPREWSGESEGCVRWSREHVTFLCPAIVKANQFRDFL